MDYNTLIVLVGLVSSGLLLGSFGALVSLRGENLTADVAGHGVVSGVVLSQGVTVWLGLGAWLAVPVLWVLGFTSSALILGFIFFLRWRGYSVGASQALAIALAYGSSLVLLSVVQATGAFSTKGLTLLVGMLTLPALIVRPWVTSFTGLVLGSALVGGLVSGVAGWLSAGVLPLPTGALVVVSLGAVWALGSLAAGLRPKGVRAR